MKSCIKNINKGMIVRVILTIFFILTIKYNKIKNLLLIIPITYMLLDHVDSTFSKIHNKKCFKTFHYQKYDKIVDIFSYILLLFIYPNDRILLYFILYRLAGVILFSQTKNSTYLIIFFDFIKEYILYKHFYKNYNKIHYYIIIKIIIEVIMHKYLNKNNYINQIT